MNQWIPHFDDPNVLVIKYEDMLRDLTDAVKRIANFIGGSAVEAIKNGEDLKTIVTNCSFGNMSKNNHIVLPVQNEDGQAGR